MPVDMVETLQAILGRTFNRAEAEQVSNATRSFPVPAKRTVVREGDPGSGLYFLLTGQVEVFKARKDGAVQRLALVEGPSMLGEMALVTEEPHSATCRTVSDCDFRVLSRAEFNRWLATGQLTAYKLMGAISGVLARRLMHLNEVVLDLSSPGGSSAAAPSAEEMAKFKERLFSEWAF
jgi:CRP-like cAMP-binding protein